MRTFGSIIEAGRRQQGITQSELGRAIGHSPSRVAQIEGEENLSERVFRECLRALDLDVEMRIVLKPPARRRVKAARDAERAAAARKLRRRPNGG